jgi:hypothetical protein
VCLKCSIISFEGFQVYLCPHFESVYFGEIFEENQSPSVTAKGLHLGTNMATFRPSIFDHRNGEFVQG